MKNRLFWFLLLVLIIFVAFVYLINRQESQKNIKKEKEFVKLLDDYNIEYKKQSISKIFLSII